ncbi:PEP-CTERM sorting domain-containing protein [Cerasicoccus fimbriatus]|uniref:PEP-CTERM sorting domain-containing protein n=1 Tax=Cerasicoccus fimbriatus TaxID=3014554 RepID=UPI0022B4D7BD|nr:PEP-CTERM sorting domain-containing protein [Cerasicoccus sp. TK19100]
MKLPSTLFTLTLALSSFSASATVFTLISDTADTYIGLNSSDEPVIGDVNGGLLLNGDNNSAFNNLDGASILVFELPDLAGETLADATLEFTITGGSYLALGGSGTLPKGIDLYGLRYNSASTVQISDYGFGDNPGNGTELQQDVFEITTNDNGSGWPSTISSDIPGGANIASWIQSLYDSGAVAGDYAFLRLNLDDGTNNALFIASGNSTDISVRPNLTLTTVPEPSIYTALFGLLTLGFVLQRRRR